MKKLAVVGLICMMTCAVALVAGAETPTDKPIRGPNLLLAERGLPPFYQFVVCSRGGGYAMCHTGSTIHGGCDSVWIKRGMKVSCKAFEKKDSEGNVVSKFLWWKIDNKIYSKDIIMECTPNEGNTISAVFKRLKPSDSQDGQ